MADIKLRELDIVKYINPQQLENDKPEYGTGLANLFGIVRDAFKDKCYIEFFGKNNKPLNIVCRPYSEVERVGSMFGLVTKALTPVEPKVIVKKVIVKEPRASKEDKPVKEKKERKPRTAKVKAMDTTEEIVSAKNNKLHGLRILPTGLFDNFSRQGFVNNIVENGGIYGSGGVNKKLDILVVGRAAGPAKINKANELGIKMITEKEYLDMIK